VGETLSRFDRLGMNTRYTDIDFAEVAFAAIILLPIEVFLAHYFGRRTNAHH
jgi:hypothetical protein